MAKILVVDDEVELMESVKALLEQKDHKVLMATDGAAGFAKAKAEKPDLIVLDVMMTTDSEGFDVARQLRAEPATAHIPVIMLTGIRRAKNLPFAFEPDEDWLPVKAVLEKPVKPEVLYKSVEEALK